MIGVARQVACKDCGNGKPLPRHCGSPSCPWVRCLDHGVLPLSASRRAWLRGEGDA